MMFLSIYHNSVVANNPLAYQRVWSSESLMLGDNFQPPGIPKYISRGSLLACDESDESMGDIIKGVNKPMHRTDSVKIETPSFPPPPDTHHGSEKISSHMSIDGVKDTITHKLSRPDNNMEHRYALSKHDENTFSSFHERVVAPVTLKEVLKFQRHKADYSFTCSMFVIIYSSISLEYLK